LIEVFRIFERLDDISSEIFFQLNTSNLRRHSMKIIKRVLKSFRLEVGNFSISNSVHVVGWLMSGMH